MFKRKAASHYLAVSLTALTLCGGTQPSLVLAQSSETVATPAKRATTVALSGTVAENSSLTEEQISAIISDGLRGHEQALLAWNADKVTIPELVITIPGKTKKAKPTVITYRDVVLTNVKDGEAETLTATSLATTNKLGQSLFDPISFTRVNFANIARVLEPAAAEISEFYPLFASAKLDGGTFGNQEFDCVIGSVSSSDYQMRAIGQTLSTLLDLTSRSQFEELEDITLVAPLLTSYADLVTSVKSGPTEIASFSCVGDRDQQEDAENPTDTVDIGPIRISAIEPGYYPEVNLTNLRTFFDKNYHFFFEDLTFKALDFTSLLNAVETAPSPLTEEWIEANQRRLMPNFGGLSFSGMSYDATDKDPFSVTADAFDLTLENYINGNPSKVDISANSIIVDIPPTYSDEIFDLMRNAGITQFDGSFRVAGHWNEADETIRIEEASFDLKDMASLKLTALLSNAQRLLFALDYKDAMRAGRELALKSIDLDVTDNGIGDVALAAVSGEMGADAKAMRPIYADLVKGTIIAYLADLAEAADLGDAIAKFIGGSAQNLHIGITAKSADGISLEAFAAAEDDPSAILSQINVAASAK